MYVGFKNLDRLCVVAIWERYVGVAYYQNGVFQCYALWTPEIIRRDVRCDKNGSFDDDRPSTDGLIGMVRVCNHLFP